jgi:hypothetical protein
MRSGLCHDVVELDHLMDSPDSDWDFVSVRIPYRFFLTRPSTLPAP